MSRKPQFEALLKAAERGSVAQIRRLEKEWPRDISSSVRTLSIVMGHFVNGLPTVHDIQWRLSQGRAEFPLSEVWDTLALIRASFGALRGAFEFINKDASDAQVRRMFTVIRPNVDALVSWCDFVARNSGLVFPDHAKDHGNYVSYWCLGLLLQKGVPFLAETDVLNRIVEIILWLWTFGTDPYEQRGVVLSPTDYTWYATRRNDALSEVLDEDRPTRDILLNKINSLSHSGQKRLAKVFCRRVREWVAVHEELYQQDPTTFNGCFFTYICVLAQALAFVPSFCRALTDCKFWHLLVTTALNFRDAPAPSSAADPERGSIATEIAFYLCKPHSQSAHDILQIIPQCLDAGVLEILIDDVVGSPTGLSRPPRFSWNGECSVATPFHLLYSISHYPVILKAVISAAHSLPEGRVAAIQPKSTAGKACSMFFAGLEDFKDGLNNHKDDRDPPLCDCLQHEEVSPHFSSPDSDTEVPSDTESEPNFKTKECSGCRAVVYCSIECQREDWEVIHRDECMKNRAERFEPEASGLRMTHQTRMFYLRNLCSIVNAVSRMEKSHEHRNCCFKPEKNRAFVLDQRDMPLQWSTMEADDILDWEANLKGDPGAKIFNDLRFRAMIDESYEYEDVHVACSIAMLGEYVVATMGRFIFCDVDPESGSESGPEGHEEFEVHLLGGAVKVLELN